MDDDQPLNQYGAYGNDPQSYAGSTEMQAQPGTDVDLDELEKYFDKKQY
jgi:hypothetical protein